MIHVAALVSNGTQNNDHDFDQNKTMGLKAHFAPMENLKFNVNYLSGTEAVNAAGGGIIAPTLSMYKNTVTEVNGAYMLNEMLDFALDYTNRQMKPTTGSTGQATSIAAYANAHFGMYGLGLRYENFSYKNSIMGSNPMQGAYYLPSGQTKNSINSITLAAHAELDQNLRLTLEYRMDNSSKKIWMGKTDTSRNTKSVNVATIALQYTY